MKFSQKKTCKGCQLACDDFCGVRILHNNFGADVPLEPCFKPRTNKDLSTFLTSLKSIQDANLSILRVKGAE